MAEDSKQRLARSELTKLLTAKPFTQSVGIEVAKDIRANNGYLADWYLPSTNLLVNLDTGVVKELVDRATRRPTSMLNDLRFMTAVRMHVATSSLPIRLLTVPGDGATLNDLTYVEADDDPRLEAPRLVSACGMAMEIRRRRPPTTGWVRVVGEGRTVVDEVARLEAAAARYAEVDLPPVAVVALAFIDGDRCELGFLNLSMYAERFVGTTLTRAKGTEVELSTLVANRDLWMTVDDLSTWLLARATSIAPSAIAEVTSAMEGGRVAVGGVHEVRLTVRSTAAGGELVPGFTGARYHQASGGLMIHVDQLAHLRSLRDALRELEVVRDRLRGKVRDAFRPTFPNVWQVNGRRTEFDDVLPDDLWYAVDVNPFISAYRGVYRAHPWSFVSLDTLLDREAMLAGVGQNAKVIPPSLIYERPPFPTMNGQPSTLTWMSRQSAVIRQRENEVSSDG